MSAIPTASEQAIQYLRLHLVEGIGPILTARLVQQFGSIEAVLAAPISRLQSVEGIGRERGASIAAVDDGAALREIELAATRGVRIICPADAEYPELLGKITDPPIVLYVRGALQREDALALGVVGSRHCSMYGAEQAERLAGLAAESGLTVVSGMALGIDTAAHRCALRAQGRTIAVLGCGMCHLYPPRSGELAEQIAMHGAVIGEFPMGVPPDEHNFPRRNRIIAGLSLGVLVVEASLRSGALITARLASEYNREVFAVPGRIDTPHAEGCHHLIRSGAAKLVTNLADVLEELGDAGRMLLVRTDDHAAGDSGVASPSASVSSRAREQGSLFGGTPGAVPGPAPSAALSEYEQAVLGAMPHEPATIEAITMLSGLTPARVAATLTSLQLKGYVRREQGDLYSKVAYA